MGDGGAQAPFDGKSAKSALGSFMEEYVCANNFFKCELEFNVDPNVPIRASMVEEIKSYYYKDAALFAEPFEVSVPSAWLDNMSKLDMVKPIVSIEHRIAFVLPLGCCP
ncbi:Gyltl1b [Symbiodinium necroappetens]|uniref:Gyltl1b protein n=1 Tax=Symbiodinium necroappetens TaxID=1628268 RepID=A0A813BM07_9DINO|nr:Gyltl1b [Symbiodinium sp. CCMP2456]CAE7911533.1 Gyltl1b [Symbiodinium necroappetens]